MARWIETSDTYQYVVRESVSYDEIVDRGNGVKLYAFTDVTDQSRKTAYLSFEKSLFPSIDKCNEWLTSFTMPKDSTYEKRAAYVSKDELGVDSGPMRPSQEQLAKINTFTRTAKTEDEVVVFPTLACNDLIDRDIEAFTPKALKQFVELEGDLGIAGKSLMLSHNYRSLPTGRLFDAETMRKGGMNAVRAWTYVPNTDQYKSFIENIDYGVFWAVSIGARLKSVTCSVCKGKFDWFFNWVCENGHEKGSYYDPNADGTKSPGMAKDDGTNLLCYAKMEDPTDFFELSVVFLGAQYAAAFEKNAKEGFMKAASADLRASSDLRLAYDLSGHMISVKADEIDDVFAVQPPLPPMVSVTGNISTGTQPIQTTTTVPTIVISSPQPGEDSNARFVEALKDLKFEPLEATQSKKGKDKGGNGVSDALQVIAAAKTLAERVEFSVAELKKGLLSVRAHAADGNEAVGTDLDSLDTEVAALATSLDGLKAVSIVDPEDEETIKELLSGDIIATGPQLREAQSALQIVNAALEVLKSEAETLKVENTRLQSFATAGEAYTNSMKESVVRLYRILNAKPNEEPGKVDVSFAEKLVEKCGDDIELLGHLVKDYESQVRIKLPGEGVLQSSVAADAETIPGVTNGAPNGAEEASPPSGNNRSRIVQIQGK